MGITVEEIAEYTNNDLNAGEKAVLLAWSAEHRIRKAPDRAAAREVGIPIVAWILLPPGNERANLLKYAKRQRVIKYYAEHPELTPRRKSTSGKPRQARTRMDPVEAATRQEQNRQAQARRRENHPEAVKAAKGKYNKTHADTVKGVRFAGTLGSTGRFAH